MFLPLYLNRHGINTNLVGYYQPTRLVVTYEVGVFTAIPGLPVLSGDEGNLLKEVHSGTCNVPLQFVFFVHSGACNVSLRVVYKFLYFSILRVIFFETKNFFARTISFSI